MVTDMNLRADLINIEKYYLKIQRGAIDVAQLFGT
jgi:hypothetical protein